MAVNEEIISQFEIILSELLELSGAAENTRIDFNLEVVDASPSAPLTNYVIVSGGPGGTFNGPALKVPGLTYATGDKVNVIFKKGTEPVAMQQGSASSGTNAGLWTKVTGTDDIYYDDGNVSIGFDASGDTLLHILSQSGVTNDGLTIEKYGAGSPLMQFRAAAGTLASPQELGLSASGAQWDFYGYEGTTPAFSLGARMSVTLDDAISGTEAPMRFRFFTHRTGVGLTEALRIAAAGNVESDLGYVFIGDEDSGVFYQGVDNWTLEAGGVAFVELTEDTQDTLEFGTSSNDIDMSFYYNGGTALSIAGDTGNGTFGADVSILGGLIVNENSADEDVRFESNNNANMFFMDGGNDVVIIGGATQQTTGSQLEVHKASDGYVTLYNSGDTSAERGMYLRFNHSGGLGAQIGFYRPISSSAGGNIIFATQPSGGGALIPAMYIDSNQRIGIGGLPTLGLMHFQGSMSSGGLAAMFLDPTTSGSGTMYGLRVVGQIGAAGFFGIGIHGGTNLSTNWIASLWVGNEANRPGISIGYGSSTKAPTHGIIVAGNAGFKTSGPTHTLQLGDDDAAKTTTTTWTTTSDGRAKRNVKRYGRGLADVLALPSPVEFEFNGQFATPEGARGVGFVAQDLAKVAPEMIRNLTRDGEAALGVNPNDLIYMLVNAVREMAAEIESLKGAE